MEGARLMTGAISRFPSANNDRKMTIDTCEVWTFFVQLNHCIENNSLLTTFPAEY